MQSPNDFTINLDSTAHGDARARRASLEAKYCALIASQMQELSSEERQGFIQIFRMNGSQWAHHANTLQKLNNGSVTPTVSSDQDEYVDLSGNEKKEESLQLNVKNVVEVENCGLYAKSPEALQALFTELKRRGYDIDDLSKRESGSFIADKNEPGCSLWFAKLRDDVRELKAKCNSCKSYIDRRGTGMHKHECECCGEFTYLKFTQGGTVTFSFIDDPERGSFSDITMSIHGYDDETKCLLLEPEPISRWGQEVAPERSKKVLERNQGNWQWQGAHIAVRYDTTSYRINDKTDINIFDSTGEEKNVKTVQIYNGKEYGEYEKLPIPDTYNIYEAWHWAPLKPSSRLHENIIHAAGMVSDKGYYYQDGRVGFYDIHLTRMRTFVEHCTTLDLRAWDSMIKRADKSGPGMIDAIAHFCHRNPRVTEKPNIGNWMVAAGKVLEGGHVTEAEEIAALMADMDPTEGKKVRELQKHLQQE